jgi:hypothetical protein
VRIGNLTMTNHPITPPPGDGMAREKDGPPPQNGLASNNGSWRITAQGK